MDTVVRLEEVRKSYPGASGAPTEVLHGVNMTLAAGEFVALMGPSGSGKSTLLNLIGLLDRPSGGRLTVAGRETSMLDDAAITRLRGRSIGFVFQYHYLITAFSAIENVMMPMLLAHCMARGAMEERAALLLDQVGLTPWRDSRVNYLSGGQQQRVAIARALAMSPPLVLADEPTGNLDTKSADGVFEVMREVNRSRGTTFLLVTHNPVLAARCDRIVELVDGRIVAPARAPQDLPVRLAAQAG
jgi:lipoprotein-releasing system ATP-binding protein